MTDVPLSDRLKIADDLTLQEILRETEAYLSAQLTAAIAADQRAYTFAGTVTAASVLLVGAAYAVTTSGHPSGWLAILASGVAACLFVSAWLAVVSARSIGFEFAGNQPCQWIADIESKKSLLHALAEQCAHYDGMIEANRAAMEGNGRLFNWAVNIALASVGFGGLFFIWWMAKSFAM